MEQQWEFPRDLSSHPHRLLPIQNFRKALAATLGLPLGSLNQVWIDGGDSAPTISPESLP